MDFVCYLNNIFPLTNAGVLHNRVCAFYYDYYYTEINTRIRPHTKLCIRVLERTIQTQAFWLNCALVPVEVDSSNPDSYQGRKNSNSVPMFMFVCCVCVFLYLLEFTFFWFVKPQLQQITQGCESLIRLCTYVIRENVGESRLCSRV